MIPFSMAQLRRDFGRAFAAGVAVAISTSFVTAAILATDLVAATLYATRSADVGTANVIIQGVTSPDRVDEIKAIDGVLAAEGQSFSAGIDIDTGAGTIYAPVNTLPQDPMLRTTELISGTWATGPREIVLPQGIAESLEATIGHTITYRYPEQLPSEAGNGDVTFGMTTARATVVGIATDAIGPSFGPVGSVFTASDHADEIARALLGSDPLEYTQVLVLTAPGRAEDVTAALVALGLPGRVISVEQYASEQIDVYASVDNWLPTFGFGIAGLAVVVAALIIANTFNVIVANRTSLLGLLRCLGADKGQIRRRVLGESVLLGVGGSVIGVLLGVMVVHAGRLVFAEFRPDVPVPSDTGLPLNAITVPLITGLVVSVVAALIPAYNASRVAPLEATRPPADPAQDRAGRRIWMTTGVTMAVLGFGVMVWVVLRSRELPAQDWVTWSEPSRRQADLVTAGLVAATALVTGVIITMGYWPGPVVEGLGRLFARGPASQIALTNASRNAVRTSATVAALVIGAVIVAVMTTGTASGKRVINERFSDTYPVDIQIVPYTSTTGGDGTTAAGPATGAGSGTGTFRPADVATLTNLPGVDAWTVVDSGFVQVLAEGTQATKPGGTPDDAQPIDALWVIGANPAAVDEVWAEADLDLDMLSPGTIVFSTNDAGTAYTAGETILLEGIGGPVPLTVKYADVPIGVYVSAVDFAGLRTEVSRQLWIKLTDHESVQLFLTDARPLVAHAGAEMYTPILERVYYARTLDTALYVVLALVVVAFIVAVVGIANALSLSLLDRRHEWAMMRAFGMSRSQLRRSLAFEGTMLALVSVILGTAIGVPLGWVGTQVVLGPMTVPAMVPLILSPTLLGMVVLAVFAGLAASVIPGRGATKGTPVELLTVD